MIDIFDLIHYLIGIIILVFILWLLIQTHNYFSKDNIRIANTNTSTSTSTSASANAIKK
jgi:cell division septal protein FtsQ